MPKKIKNNKEVSGSRSSSPGGIRGRKGGRAATSEVQSLAYRLREVRGGLTQDEFAKLIEMSVHIYRRCEYGQRELTDEEVARLVEACNVNKDWLLTGEGPKTTTGNDELPDLAKEAAFLDLYVALSGPVESVEQTLEILFDEVRAAAKIYIFLQMIDPLTSSMITREDARETNNEQYKYDMLFLEENIKKIKSDLETIPTEILDKVVTGSTKTEALSPKGKKYAECYSIKFDEIIFKSIRSIFTETGISLPVDEKKGFLEISEFILRRYSLLELITMQKIMHDFIVKNPIWSSYISKTEFPYIDLERVKHSDLLSPYIGIAPGLANSMKHQDQAGSNKDNS
jgi:transcriptional regulator with XRE-family HTH domain